MYICSFRNKCINNSDIDAPPLPSPPLPSPPLPSPPLSDSEDNPSSYNYDHRGLRVRSSSFSKMESTSAEVKSEPRPRTKLPAGESMGGEGRGGEGRGGEGRSRVNHAPNLNSLLVSPWEGRGGEGRSHTPQPTFLLSMF